MPRSKPSAPPRRRAFTMVEVLVATAVLAILASMLAAGIQGGLGAADRAAEINAGRQLITAYQLAAAENDGRYLGGYDRRVNSLEVLDGRHLSTPASNRYTFRLLPYLDNIYEGTLRTKANSQSFTEDDLYTASTLPAFALNYKYVGGDINSEGETDNAHEVVSRVSQSCRILAFASASNSTEQGNKHGYNILTPPQIYGPMWSSGEWSEGSNPANFGHVHARHNGMAVCIFLDGSVELLTIDQLRDMRLWSRSAADANNPSYTITYQPSSGGGRR